jgi:transaldolase
MASNPIQELNEFGQSVWLDNINRAMITSGKLSEWITLGLRGMTSNPSIFDNAISKSSDYDEEIRKLKAAGKSVFEVYDALTIRDVQDAADLYLPIYEASGGLDGYVSLEINPKLARRTAETVGEGRRLNERVDRPNVMFKVPSTEEGFTAVEDLIADGININVTLIFSNGQYVKTAQAFMRGMKRYIAGGGEPGKVASVASVFVSRVDSSVDKTLDAKMATGGDQGAEQRLGGLRGKAATANSALIYRTYLDILDSEDFAELTKQGVRPQRVLWGSTSTKDPAYSDIKYVTDLIARRTVNTLPDKTFEAFHDHGVVGEALTSDVAQARKTIEDLEQLGISIDSVCAELLDEGVVKFEKSFDSLLGAIGAKMGQS